MDASAITQLTDPTHAWRFEARKLHERRGWDAKRAYDHVLIRYLVAGNPWPLLDLIRGRFRQCKPLYEIRISERRGRGRPGADDPTKTETRWRLFLGFSALADGKQPPNAFWLDFGYALFHEQYVRWSGQPFPFKAKLVRKDRSLGRPRDPEIQARDEALAAAINRKIAGGLKYEAAIEEVRAEIELQCRADRALGRVATGMVSRGTIRAAYDKWSHRREEP